MNPLGIIALVVAIIVGYYAISGAGIGVFSGPGPIASGPGPISQIQNPQPVNSRGFFNGFFLREGSPSGSAPPPAPAPGDSPYKGKVHLSSIQRSGDRPEQEYVSIRSEASYYGSASPQLPIDVTGWQVASTRSSALLPRAFNIPEIDASEQDIFLPPGGEVIAVSGTPSYTQNFRENACSGYFNEAHVFTPSLSYSCADDNPNRGVLISRGFNGACIDAIEAIPACTRPHGTYLAGVLGVDCVNYIVENFNYASCVASFRDKKDFLKNKWRVSFKLPRKLFDPLHDRITLRDRNGLLVDQFEY